MKKVVRIVWIGVLTGMAFLVACSSQGRLTRCEKKHLKEVQAEIESSLQYSAVPDNNDLEKVMEYKQWEMEQRTRLQDVNELLRDTEAMGENKAAMDRLTKEMNDIDRIIKGSIAAPVYGPPTREIRAVKRDTK